MSQSSIEVRVQGRGTVRDTRPTVDEKTEARCDLCGKVADAVVTVAADGRAPFSCKSCLRERLEAITVGLWMLREPGASGLPWGKISG